MFLQDELNITIKAYELALIPENQNHKYLVKNFLEHGLCYFCQRKNFIDLMEFISLQDFFYLCDTPIAILAASLTDLEYKQQLNRVTKHRLDFLQRIKIINNTYTL
jgi:hypothetical protein